MLWALELYSPYKCFLLPSAILAVRLKRPFTTPVVVIAAMQTIIISMPKDITPQIVPAVSLRSRHCCLCHLHYTTVKFLPTMVSYRNTLHLRVHTLTLQVFQLNGCAIFSLGVMFEHFGRKIFTDPINNLIAISTLLDGISGRVLLYKPSKKEIVYDANSTISAGYELETEFSSPGELLDGFATAIGLYNNSLLIGAPNSNTVYAYAPDDVTGKFRLYQTITPEDKLHHSKFGCSISINNDNG